MNLIHKSSIILLRSTFSLALGLALGLLTDKAQAATLTFNSPAPSSNATTRQNWLDAIGIKTPQHLVDFESGFVNGQNISGIGGLFPDGLIITDTSSANQAIMLSGTSVINGSNPVGQFALTQNERAFLQLDFSTNPVDYVAFQDIDQAGTTGIVTFTDNSTANISFETTAVSANSAEFFGIFRNDMPRISLVQLDASGDGRWGVDNIEYGISSVTEPVPEPLTIFGTVTALAFGTIFKRKNKVPAK